MSTASSAGQNFIGVWSDENSKKKDNTIYVDLRDDLDTCFDHLGKYERLMDCLAYIHSFKSGILFLIMSHKHAYGAKEIIKNEALSKIHAMYIFCSNESEQDSWRSTNIEKLRGVYTSKDNMIRQLKIDINLINNNNEILETPTTASITQDSVDQPVSNQIPTISVFSSKPINNMIVHLDKNSITFVQYKILFEIILKLEKSTTEADEMIYVCRNRCERDKKRLEQIEDFDKDVKDSSKSIDWINWYTKDSFVVHMLNKTCGSQNIHEIYPFRLFIQNLHKELHDLDALRCGNNQEHQLTVFRGKLLPLSTFEKLKSNKNGLISMNGFLSTTRDISVAKAFSSGADLKNDHKAVLFKLNIDPKVVDKPYADIPPERHAKKDQEQEILFSVNSLWRIVNVYQLPQDTK